jgi:hypothetical protein
MNLKNIVIDLNCELFEKFDDTQELKFGYSTDGTVEVIEFGTNVLWCSENDDREFDEGTNEYEPFKPFIKRKFNEWIDKLYLLKF